MVQRTPGTTAPPAQERLYKPNATTVAAIAEARRKMGDRARLLKALDDPQALKQYMAELMDLHLDKLVADPQLCMRAKQALSNLFK